ncbi:hypothetical protein [Streptomyces shenzhenensis]|uniref:hypothetical protein n=1 Tax=Streptomyces shenzhenensis TaxID=943815 RepID=UPI001F1FBA1F|nr:hypothetical protein [Streptomyces shenzhenensis]
MPARRPVRRTAVAAAAVALLAVSAAGCGDSGGLRGAGATPTAISPAKLWPDLRPASSPAWPYDEGSAETVKDITVPGDDIHKVDPVAVVQAEIGSDPADYGSAGAYHDTATRMRKCRARGGGAGCSLLKPYYRDLTGDGRDELTVGFRLYPTNQTALRVYTVEGHRLVRVLDDDDAIIGVELAGRTVIVRSPAGISGYEYRTTWAWDPQRKAMVFFQDEFLRIGRGHRTRRPIPVGTPSASASASASSVSASSASASAGAR